MAEAVTDGVPDENNNRIMKAVNDSEYSDDDFRYFALKLIDLHPSLDKDHLSKFYAIRTFAMNLDEMRLAAEAGLDAVDALYKKYNIARNERTSLIIDPNVKEATFSLTLANGQTIKVKVDRKPDGKVDMYIIGQEE